MKKVLIIHYSQSGQLDRIVERFVQPLVESDEVSVTFENLRPCKPFPFPWPFFRFLDTFPECVYLDPPLIQPLSIQADEEFDLIILAYQVWFLSPSLPVTAFLKSPEARRLLHNRPAVTLIACRNMWLMAQEQVKDLLASLGARLVGNVALVDEAGTFWSFLATPLWVLTGNKGPHLGGLVPAAGVAETEIRACDRFGTRILERLESDAPLDTGLLKGLNAVNVDARLISSETMARRSFRAWGALLRLLGPPGGSARKPMLVIYLIFLLTFILTFVPLSILIKKLLAPLSRARIEQQKIYFGQPSGVEPPGIAKRL